MNDIHPTALIGENVELGSDNVIGAFAVILGPARIGDRNWFGPHVVIGTPAEIRGTEHGSSAGRGMGGGVEIGSGNVIREYTTVHQGYYAVTIVGDDCYLMNKVYIGHDDVIGDGVTMASGATLGGHVHVGTGANLGMGATVHQRRIIGPSTMLGMGAVVVRDIPPFALAYGNPCRVRGANRVGMQRAGVAAGTIDSLDSAYRAGRHDASRCVDETTGWAWAWWDSERDAGTG